MYLKVKQWMPCLMFQVLDRPCKCIALVRLEMWRDQEFFHLHDNARPYTAAIVQQFLTKRGVAQSSHLPYLPNLSPLPLWLLRFPKIKIGAERWPLCFDRRHSEIYNSKIKSVPTFWLCVNYEMVRRSRWWVFLNVRRLFRINITYLNFLHLFSQFSQHCHKTYRTHELKRIK